MKKILFLAAVAASMLTACNEGGKSNFTSDATADSLQSIIDQKDSEINELMGSILEVENGFALINEAEGRVNMMKTNAENNNTASNIKENMEFIQHQSHKAKRGYCFSHPAIERKEQRDRVSSCSAC